MKHIDELSTEQISVLKQWLFAENIRIEQEKKKLEQDKYEFTQATNQFKQEKEAHLSMHELMKKQLVREKRMVDQQLGILQKELTLLAYDKEKIKKEKELLARESASQSVISSPFLFKGVCNSAELRRRYKDLIKIFHPDNSGDKELMQMINKEYEKYKMEL